MASTCLGSIWHKHKCAKGGLADLALTYLFSSPDTPSQSYARFASKCLHLDTFLSRSGSGNFRDVRLLFWSNSICAKWTFLTTYRYAQMRSRSTPVGPNRRRRLKVLVLSTEMNFEAFLEAILESSERKKYPVRAEHAFPPTQAD